MSPDLQAFRRLVNLSKQEVGRVVFHQYADRIRIKKEPLAVRNLIKIVDAALVLSNQKGFHAMSLKELSAAAGLSMGGLYAYIRTKEELSHLIQSFGYTMSVRILLDQLKDIHAPLEQLRIAVRTHLFLSEILQEWFFFAYMEAKNMAAKEKQHALQAELSTEELFCNIIIAGQRQGVFREIDPRLSAALLQAMLQDWFLKRWKYQKHQIDVETYASFLQSLMEKHLLPDA